MIGIYIFKYEIRDYINSIFFLYVLSGVLLLMKKNNNALVCLFTDIVFVIGIMIVK